MRGFRCGSGGNQLRDAAEVDGDHVAVDQIGRTALFLGDGVEVFQRTDVIGGHPAVLPGDGVALHTALVIAAHQAVQIELNIETPATGVPGLLAVCEEGAVHGLLDAHQPGADGVHGKVDALVLDIAEGSPVKIAHQMGRHAVDAADLFNLKTPGFEELRLIVGEADWREGHILFQNGNLAAVGRAAVGRVPVVAQTLGITYRVRVRQHTAGACAIFEEGAAVFLGGDAQTDGVLFQRDGTVTHDAVKAQTRNVQHIRGLQRDRIALRGRVGVDKRACLAIPVHLHAVREQRVQAGNVVLARADDLAVGIAPQQQMAEHDLAQDEGGHLGVRLIVEDSVQRMICRLLTAGFGLLIDRQRQGRDGFSDHTHAGIDRGHLHGVLGVDRFARIA